MLESLLNYLIEKTNKDLGLEIFLEWEEGEYFEYKKEYPFLEKSFKEIGCALRYLNAEGLAAVVYILNLEKEVLENSIAFCKELSKKGKPTFYPPLKKIYPEVPLPPYKPLSKEELRINWEEIKELIFSFPEIHSVERKIFTQGRTKIFLIREGKILTSETPYYSFFISLVAKSSKKSATGYAYQKSLRVEDLDFKEIVKKAALRAKNLSLGEKASSKKCPILFPPDIAVELLSLLSFSFKGDEITKGRSFLKDKLNQKVFSEKFSLIDDGLNPELPESRSFDDEGVPQSTKILVTSGRVNSFIWDYFYSQQAKETSTGNARKPNLASAPKVGFTNLYISPGPWEPKELLQKGGLVFEVLEILGAHTANPISGDFSFGVSGILYHEGEPIDFLSEMALSGNIFDLFKDLEIGKDLTFFHNLGSPSLLIPDLTLS